MNPFRSAAQAVRLLAIIFSLLALIGCPNLFDGTDGTADGDDGTDQVIETNEEHNTALNELGVTTDLGSRQDPNGLDLSEDYNPVGPKVGVLFKQCEIFAAGVGMDGKNHGLYGDRTESTDGYPLLAQVTGDDGEWATGYAKKSLAADVDGDGYDEIVVAVAYETRDEVVLLMYEYADGTLVDEGEVATVAVSGLSNIINGSCGGGSDWENNYASLDMARGDLDGDGRDELILVVGRYLTVLDDGEASFALLANKTIEDINSDKTSYVRVDTADFDVDGRDEIVAANGEGNTTNVGRYYVFDDIVDSPDLSAMLSSGDLQTTAQVYYGLSAADVACGDFDGDGLPETAFSGRKHNAQDQLLLVLDTAMDAESEPVFAFLASQGSDNYEYGDRYWITGVAAGDMDGDGDDEIATYNDVYAVENGAIGYHQVWGNEALVMGANYDDNYPNFEIIQAGDVTGDKKADVVYLTMDDDQIYIFSVKTDGTLGLYDGWFVDPAPSDGTLCLPNMDDDSAVLLFQEQELLFTDPVFVAVLASPPYFSGVNEDGKGGTGFGSIEGHATEEGSSHGFSTGFSFGASFNAPFGLGEAELKTTVENSFDWGTATTHEVTETWGYTTGVGEDKVIFTAIPFDVYYYEVLSSPEGDQIGEIVTINVPRKPGKYHQTVDYFNSHTTGIALDGTVLTHTTGSPFSYADMTDRDELESESSGKGLFSNHSVSVGTSSTGTSVITLEDLITETDTYEYELGVTVEAEVSAGGVLAGGSVGYRYGYSYSTSVSRGTYIEGEVPDVPEADYDSDKAFVWGLMAYPVIAGGQEFTMVTYWVDK